VLIGHVCVHANGTLVVAEVAGIKGCEDHQLSLSSAWGDGRMSSSDAQRIAIERGSIQLNRGEGRHALTKRLFFGNAGVFRTGEADELMNKVSALSVLSNAVLIWNTARMAEIVAALEKTSGQSIPVDDIARLSPLLSARLLVSGRYNFDLASPPEDLEPS
jgi:TnpA family transposase